MCSREIRESSAKRILNLYFSECELFSPSQFYTVVYPNYCRWDLASFNCPWLKDSRLIVKPDELFKERRKLGFVKLDLGLSEVKSWINEHMMKEIQIGRISGKLRNFIIEKYIPHDEEKDEMYICIQTERSGDRILFHSKGGVNFKADESIASIFVPIGEELTENEIKAELLSPIKTKEKECEILSIWIFHLYKAFSDLYFTFLEINPLVIKDGKVHILDVALKIDTASEYLMSKTQYWSELEIPAPFGKESCPEEGYINYLNSKSGSCLKLTVINPKGRIWTMVAGGGASIIFADSICEMGQASELANYGEYSGAPTEQQAYEYCKTILSLMTKEMRPEEGKLLLIGGGIANYTSISTTFKGIANALLEYKEKLIDFRVSVFVRRAGPGRAEGFQVLRNAATNIKIPIHIFGSEINMTDIVGMALGKLPISYEQEANNTESFLIPGERAIGDENRFRIALFGIKRLSVDLTSVADQLAKDCLFTKCTKCIIWGMNARAVQGMLDFDYVCKRSSPSVVAMAYPLVTGDHKQKFYWGYKEYLIPVYKNVEDAYIAHPDSSVLINFASAKHAMNSTLQALDFPQIRTIAIISEGIPENHTRRIIRKANEKDVCIIGPSTIGGIKPGSFKIGYGGGMMDNILQCKLYRSGSVGLVTRSSGISNELNSIICKCTDGVYEGISIGGDRFPGTSFMYFIEKFEKDPEVKMIVMLGEAGGDEEYEVCEALKEGKITKPLVGYVIGHCMELFSTKVQFGHSCSVYSSSKESALEKNEALRSAGAYVPTKFDGLPEQIGEVFEKLVKEGVIDIEEQPIEPIDIVPMDFSRARELGLIRKPESFDEEDLQSFGQTI